MSVRLIGITKPVIDECQTADQLLAFCARVSSTNQLNHATGPRLIASLIKRKEWSPLEMVSATMQIVTTRDIARQILRHRSFSFQEFSQRYSVVEADWVWRDARLQDHADRQNSIENHDNLINDQWLNVQQRVAAQVTEAYVWALEAGIAKEVARAVLPEGLTLTKLYMAGTLCSWIHYLGLRLDRKTQYEHCQVAVGCRDGLATEFPSMKDWLDV